MSLPTNFFIGRGGAETPLYNLTSYTFSEGQQGRYGPTFSTLQSRYSGQEFLTSGNLVQGAYQGYHRLTLPASGTYRFTAAGAPGTSTGNYHGGRGVIVRGDMSFNKGDEIQFILGKSGGSPHTYNAGGGGGTFVVKQAFFNSGGATNSNIVIVAGGGAGGAFAQTYAQDAQYGTQAADGDNNPASGGTNGNGGDGRGLSGSSGAAGPAAGIFSAGSNFNYTGTSSAAQSFLAGAVGATGYYSSHPSGFGGSGPGGNHAGGSGGGYSGGGGGTGNGQRSGGGGSYLANLSNQQNVGYWDQGRSTTSPSGGYLTIEYLG